MENRKKCLIYPDNDWKQKWDIIMTFVLIATCAITPLALAFGGEG